MDTQYIMDVGGESESNQESSQSTRGESIATLSWNRYVSNLFLGENIIGRSDKCDVIIDDVTVSDTHAEIIIMHDEAVIRDIRSRFVSKVFLHDPLN